MSRRLNFSAIWIIISIALLIAGGGVGYGIMQSNVKHMESMTESFQENSIKEHDEIDGRVRVLENDMSAQKTMLDNLQQGQLVMQSDIKEILKKMNKN
jgi:uncharacterized protein HemX